jgi:hypothetical protein
MIFQEVSRQNYHTSAAHATHQEIQTGSLQRIADATELMAKRYVEVLADRDNYKRWYEQEKASSKRLVAQVNALKGVITKMRKAEAEAR